MSFRRQKRWWNAYILIYERIPQTDQEPEIVDKESVVESEETKKELARVCETSGTDPTSLVELSKSLSKLALGMSQCQSSSNSVVYI